MKLDIYDKIFIGIVVLLLLIGYMRNVVDLTYSNSGTTDELVRSIGVVVIPIGMVVGWMDFDKEPFHNRITKSKKDRK